MKLPIRLAVTAAVMVSLAQGRQTTPYGWGPGLIGGGGVSADGGPLDDVNSLAADADAPSRPAASSAVFTFFPQAGTAWRDLSTTNYVDLDPTAGILDFECNERSYDGHNGNDSSIIGFQHQFIGVPVFAVEDGTVTLAHDGEPDQNLQVLGQEANFVLLTHANGLKTWYYHLKNGSVLVSSGQAVAKGQQIGLTASSGSSAYPHLHFGASQDNVIFEPNAGACRPGPSNWQNQIATNTQVRIRDFTFGTSTFTGTRGLPYDELARQGSFVQSTTPQVWMRINAMEWPASPATNIVFRRPDGTTAIDDAHAPTAGGPYRVANWFFAYNVTMNQAGTWQVELSLNGALVAVMPFSVGAAIVNRAPLPASVALEPASPGPADITICRTTPGMLHRQDPDYDIVRYRYLWQVNGVTVRDVTSAALSDVLRKGLVQSGNTVTCTITPNDGQVDGPSTTTSNLRDVNLLTNPDFSSGTTGWSLFASPDPSYIVSNVTGGVFQYYRLAALPGQSSSAVILQQTSTSLPAGARINARFKYGNSSTARRRFSVLIHDGDFSDLSVCTFWTEPGQSLLDYEIVSRTTKAWNQATISFYSASDGPDGGFNQLDDVIFETGSGPPVIQTECHDPHAPAPVGGAAGPEMLTNGNFDAGLAPWQWFGQISGQVTGGVAEFYDLPGSPSGVLLQNSLQPVAAGEALTASFEIGNSSQWRQRVTVLAHDSAFADLHACTFWIAAGQPLQTYTIITYATRNWPQAMLSIYPSTVGYAPGHQWMRVDNASLKKTPGAGLLGTGCYEPGATLPPSVDAAQDGSSATVAAAAGGDRRNAFGDWSPQGFSPMEQAAINGSSWSIDASTRSTGALQSQFDMRQLTSASLSFESRLSVGTSRGILQVSADGHAWTTIGEIPPSTGWMHLSFNLGAYAGRIVRVRFVFLAPQGTGHWDIRAISLDASPPRNQWVPK